MSPVPILTNYLLYLVVKYVINTFSVCLRFDRSVGKYCDMVSMLGNVAIWSACWEMLRYGQHVGKYCDMVSMLVVLVSGARKTAESDS